MRLALLLRKGLYAKGFDFSVQGAFVDSQLFGGLRTIPVVLPQGVDEIFGFNVPQAEIAFFGS